MKLVISLLLSLVVVFFWGRFGLDLQRYSSFIDISWRIFHGQVPYRDFGMIPGGPLSYYLQALLFHVSENYFFSARLFAAIVNLLSTLVVYIYFSKKLSRFWLLVVVGVNLVWFYGILAWPLAGRLGTFFALLVFVLWGQHSRAPLSPRKFLLLGVLSAVTFWDGLMGGLLLLVIQGFFFPFGQISKEKQGYFILGFLLGLMPLVGFVQWTGAGGWFLQDFLKRPLLTLNLSGLQAWFPQVAFWPFLLCFLMAGLLFQLRIKGPLRFFVGLVLYQWGLSFFSLAQAEGSAPLMGLILGWFISLLQGGLKKTRPLVLLFLGGLLIVEGAAYGVKRQGWESDFREKSGTEASDFFEAVSYLKDQVKPEEVLWIFPWGVLGYAQLNKVSSAPLVSFHAVDLLSGDEERIFSWLQTTTPDWILMENVDSQVFMDDKWKQRSFQLHHILEKLPYVDSFIKIHYQVEKKLPNYVVYKREL